MESRRLIIEDRNEALKAFQNISYYRLSGYMRPFRLPSAGEAFAPGARFTSVLQLYAFDRHLRILLWDALEIVENALRTRISNTLALRYGAHWHTQEDIFENGSSVSRRRRSRAASQPNMPRQIAEQVRKVGGSEGYIRAYWEKYSIPDLPPAWTCMEVLYFSHLSRICAALRLRRDLRDIAAQFFLPPQIFQSWLHALAYLRNLCAHHQRLYDRPLRVEPACLDYPHGEQIWLREPRGVGKKHIYYSLCILNYLLQSISGASDFRQKVKQLFADYKDIIPLSGMQLPADWAKEPLWEIPE